MDKHSPLSYAANLHSYDAVAAYHQIHKRQIPTAASPLTTHDLLSLIRQNSLIIQAAIEAEAEETDEQHATIAQIQHDVAQLKEYYLDAIPLFDYSDFSDAA